MRYISVFGLLVFTQWTSELLGCWYRRDYYNIVVSVSLFGVAVGIEYVRKHSNMSIKKRNSGWAWYIGGIQ
jgi:hypothetical protein